MKRKTSYAHLFKKAPKLIGLDIGCGQFKQEPIYGMPFLGMDQVRHPCVEIVHDVTVFPWPVPSHSIQIVKASHLWEHLEPKFRFAFMDECWRIVRPQGQLWLAAPHAGSPLEAAHPAHYGCPNELTFTFFDPAYPLWHSCSYKKPLPWKILRNDANLGGCLELVLEPRKTERGKPIYTKQPQEKTHVQIKGLT